MQFYIVCLLLVSSILLKIFREDFCNNFDKDPMADKLKQISEQLKENYDKAEQAKVEKDKPKEPIS